MLQFQRLIMIHCGQTLVYLIAIPCPSLYHTQHSDKDNKDHLQCINLNLTKSQFDSKQRAKSVAGQQPRPIIEFYLTCYQIYPQMYLKSVLIYGFFVLLMQVVHEIATPWEHHIWGYLNQQSLVMITYFWFHNNFSFSI